MKLVPFLFGSALALAARPACANAIVDTVAFDYNIAPDGGLIFGPGFDGRLGTLTGVSLAVDALYTPDIYAPDATSTKTTLYYGWNSLSGNNAINQVGKFDLTRSGAFLVGPPVAVDFDTGPLLNVGNYIDFPSGSLAPVFLASLDAFSRLDKPAGVIDDISHYAGTLQVTYTYTVPEPSSLLLLCAGVGFLVAGKKFFFEKKNQKTFARLS